MEWVWATAHFSVVLGGQPGALLAPSLRDGKVTSILRSVHGRRKIGSQVTQVTHILAPHIFRHLRHFRHPNLRRRVGHIHKSLAFASVTSVGDAAILQHELPTLHCLL